VRALRAAIISVVALIMLLVVVSPAMGANVLLYLTGSGEPEASMGPSSPPGGDLPNYDPNRDSAPGLVLAPTGGGVGETDPSKYQEWVFAASGYTLSVSQVVIWAATKDFDVNVTGRLEVYVMDCGSSCEVLASRSANVSGSSSFSKVTIGTPAPSHVFATGRSLVVRVVVPEDSQADVWLAYGTSTYNARVHLSQAVAGTSTTTSSTSTTSTTTPTTTSTTSHGQGGPPPNPGNGQGPPPGQPGGGQGSPGSPPGQDDATPSDAGPTVSTLPEGTSVTTVRADDGGTASPLDAPVSVNRPTPVVFTPSAQRIIAEVFDTPRDLRPEEGLMVAFATVAESVELYWQAAVGLGTVAAGLLWIGLSGKHDREPRVGRPRPRTDTV
jgi:hypothetical protein